MSYVADHMEGSPTDPNVKWTHLRPCDIATFILMKYDITLSNGQIKRILKNNGYCRRKPSKSISTGESKNREEQFHIIRVLMLLFTNMPHNPIISIDTKKKEVLGQLTRDQGVLCKKEGTPKVYDHDYSYLTTGKAIPHGIYDIKHNNDYMSIGDSHETAEFVIENLLWWWNNFGVYNYPEVTQILILCDCGGANGYRHHLFKVLLQALAAKIGLKISIVHYPPYCSKYNPIERLLFSQVHRSLKDTLLTDVNQVADLIGKTITKQGLIVQVRVVVKQYQTGKRSSKEDIAVKKILYNKKLPDLSYTILP
ncbi:ISAzo13 family transposase [Halosquirtibacter laminarini]|uniref:ISAzo13 family transposase n=1 Tax=Halosquirtibacter laminarini TaxID=3374600 RepID=A0AC61NET1_9BACT|nr:ISAzo13 family transposase [Prolixibacteraceae bacterium]